MFNKINIQIVKLQILIIVQYVEIIFISMVAYVFKDKYLFVKYIKIKILALNVKMVIMLLTAYVKKVIF